MTKLNLDQLKVNSFITNAHDVKGGKRGICLAAAYTDQCYTNDCAGGLDDGIPNRI